MSAFVTDQFRILNAGSFVESISDNSFYVTRSGPRTRPTRDDAILLFDKNGRFITPIEITDSRGSQFPEYVNDPIGITSLAKPPQINVDTRGDFIFTTLDPNGVLKVQYI